MGIRDKPTALASPWQNGFAERLIGSIRRECVDHFVVLGEAHLRRILQTYAGYYNDIRTHRSLDKDAPVSRPVQWTGIINSHAILGGLLRGSHYRPACNGFGPPCELIAARFAPLPILFCVEDVFLNTPFGSNTNITALDLVS